MFPAKHGASKHCNPRMRLHKENIVFDNHCTHAIGEHVQGEHELDKSNTNAPRTLDCSCLRPSCDSQKGYDLLHMQTNKVVNCRKCGAFQSLRALCNRYMHWTVWIVC